MTTSPASSKLNLIAKLIIPLALLGLADASFLTFKHFWGGPLPCSILNGCDTVVNSTYATWLGVPVALVGALFYLVFLILAVWYLDSGQEQIFDFILVLAVIGFGVSIYFVSLQIFVLKALCLYCLVSAGTTTALFSLSLWARFNLSSLRA